MADVAADVADAIGAAIAAAMTAAVAGGIAGDVAAVVARGVAGAGDVAVLDVKLAANLCLDWVAESEWIYQCCRIMAWAD